MNIINFGKQFEPYLLTWVQTKVASYNQFSSDKNVLTWIAYLEKLLTAGGKRVRPYLLYVMYISIKNKPTNKLWSLCLSLELFHLFALIHDDIIDKAATRRNVQTSHQFIADTLYKQNHHGDLKHVGEAQAILLGDLVLSWAFRLLEESTSSMEVKEVFQNMIDEVVVGQMLDVELMTRSHVNIHLITQKMLLKTAGYTFIQPLLLGAHLASANIDTLQFCQSFGRSLGLAFQIQDDLLDIISSTKELGKKVFTDIQDRQHTYFTQYILDHGTDMEKEKLCDLWGKALSEADRPMVMNLFESSGALKFGKQQMEQCFTEAENLLVHQDPTKLYQEPLKELVAYIRNRTS